MDLAHGVKVKLAKIIERDTIFLGKYNIMDYSLLFGVTERNKSSIKDDIQQIHKTNYPRIIFSEGNNYVYFLAIIDIFQDYNFVKKFEHSVKNLKASTTKVNMMSSIPPKDYGDRFCNFMFTRVFNVK